MTTDVTALFEPLQIKGKTLRNRIVMPPMVGLRPITLPEGIDWYGERAQGGAALVIIEATAVNRFGSELTPENLKGVVDAIHAGGALAAIQLFPVTRGSSLHPPDLDIQQIEAMVCHYGVAAQVCRAAGFDGVEPHGAHGFLLNQFFSPEINTRDDQYGGSLENRMRLGLRIVSEVRRACGDDLLVLYRHTPVGPGYGIEESHRFAMRLVEAGVDILDLSPSSIESPADRAAPFKDLGVPLITVGELDLPARAAFVLREDRADLVAVGRGLIADPAWPRKVQEDRLSELVMCVKCNKMCYGNLRAGVPIACTQWEK